MSNIKNILTSKEETILDEYKYLLLRQATLKARIAKLALTSTENMHQVSLTAQLSGVTLRLNQVEQKVHELLGQKTPRAEDARAFKGANGTLLAVCPECGAKHSRFNKIIRRAKDARIMCEQCASQKAARNENEIESLPTYDFEI